MSHYTWLDNHFPAFLQSLGIDPKMGAGLSVAHGDKCYGYKEQWEEAGLSFPHGVAIYLITHLAPYSREVRNTDSGWVAPADWVIANKERFLPHLPPQGCCDE